MIIYGIILNTHKLFTGLIEQIQEYNDDGVELFRTVDKSTGVTITAIVGICLDDINLNHVPFVLDPDVNGPTQRHMNILDNALRNLNLDYIPAYTYAFEPINE